ncbi:hypothetical protein ACKVMT_17655 [Halobacteriales archaeon Cl-PHB]
MSSGPSEEFTFVCPACGESLDVNDSMRTALLDKGCVICGSSVGEEAFSKNSKSGAT